MTTPLLFAFPGNEDMAVRLADHLGGEIGRILLHRFPDGETNLRFPDSVAGRDCAIVATLDRPDDKALPLFFAADTARELGARRVGLVAPYLAYMRQDARFVPGEAVTSRSFAQLVSSRFDWLVTVDPHLHRYKALSDIYTIAAVALDAAPLLADWVKANIADPVLVGPDRESAQWVSRAAARIGAPFTVLDKTRSGDRTVAVRLRDPGLFGTRTPVLVDDIVSSGETLLAAAKAIGAVSSRTPVCVAVHAVFAEGSAAKLAAAGLRAVTANTIAHGSNAIDVSQLICGAIAAIAARGDA
jgi:ribose-phosphate pyrophosphokinase